MKTIKFTVWGDPKSKARARHRVGKSKGGKVFSMTYKDAKTRDAEDSFIGQCVQHKPEEPVADPVGLDVEFHMPIPKSTSKKKADAMRNGKLYHMKKPDLDNLVKLVKDAMNGVFWLDDKQVVVMTVTKKYSDTPRTDVVMTWEEEE